MNIFMLKILKMMKRFNTFNLFILINVLNFCDIATTYIGVYGYGHIEQNNFVNIFIKHDMFNLFIIFKIFIVLMISNNILNTKILTRDFKIMTLLTFNLLYLLVVISNLLVITQSIFKL